MLCIPQHNAFPTFDVPIPLLPEQPTTLGPICDPDNLDKPLPVFDVEEHATAFGMASLVSNSNNVPPRPAAFCDPYLYPSLARNELTRLSMLWYYTKGIQEDNPLLQSLSQILELVRQILPWEFAIIGLVDVRTFTRLVTVGTMELAMIPRRESPCSHTINQEPGTVFAIPDMSADWRFEGAPTAGPNGLRSYAGTQISMHGPAGDVVVLGSICTASKGVQPSLTAQQESFLIRASTMVSHELVVRTQVQRMQAKQSMTEMLVKLRGDNASHDIQDIVLNALRQQYPSCSAKVIDTLGHSKIDGLTLTDASSLESGLWEDRDHIEKMIVMSQAEEQKHKRTIRALLGNISGHHQVLAVLCSEMRDIFDNLDIWFVKECATIIKDTLQARKLREALTAKEAFLSSIRHELRTPIHGILSSLELLTDELKSRGLLASTSVSTDASLSSFLRTMRLSGNELMSTVNNILRMNAINTTHSILDSPESFNLSELERVVLDEVLGGFQEDALSGISIRYENKFPSTSRFRIDYETVKEILKALVSNGIAATSKGSITITARYHELDHFLSFDVEDTGKGIRLEDQGRIFVAFEKVNKHAKGAGLGLSLAKLMTATVKGKLELIASCEGAGSHFRLEIPAIQVEKSSPSPIRRQSKSKAVHFPFYVLAQSKKSAHLLAHVEHYLQSKGILKSDKAENSLVITNEPDSFQQQDRIIRNLSTSHNIIVVTDSVPTQAWRECMDVELPQHHIIPISGPLYTSRLDEIFEKVDMRKPDQADVTVIADTCGKIDNLSISISELCLEPAPELRALLVDDNQINLSVLQFYCKKRKISHDSCLNGRRAVSLFREGYANKKQPFSLVLMDMQMPECDGIEATRSIREYEIEHDLPRSVIFMITGQDTMADRNASLKAGADEFFTKPVALKRLGKTIMNYFPDFVP